jgi:hypothetical protein
MSLDLNMSSLRTILSNIYFPDDAEAGLKYIIPKVGTWFNPQELLSRSEKPLTWIGFVIKRQVPVALPYYVKDVDEDDDEDNYLETQKIAYISLQFVGKRAESLSNQVQSWLERDDVQEQFDTVCGKLMAGVMEARPSPFMQDGLNNILAWNVDIKVLWIQKEITNHVIGEGLEAEGDF